jgi:subtilisin family serine protease
MAVRSRLPQHPLPGERGFTGVPPPGERRFISNEMVFHVAPDISRQAVEDVARRLNLSMIGAHNVALTGGTVYRLRLTDGRSVADAVHALEAEKLGVAQPNYVFQLQQDPTLAARTQGGEPDQYVVNKLRLGEVHRVATGSNVLVAVIDSEIDSRHPDLAGAFVERFDAVGRPDKPHVHGTGMAGAIVAHRALMGIAPGAKILAVHAFSPDAGESAKATTQHILAGLEWAIAKGARVINMSFAGPFDPMLALAMKKAHEKGVVLIAAAGNLGPKSPPLYPAADPNVIAVTAVDQNDHLFAGANQGPYIAVAAPGVNVLEPAPDSGYQITTGTSVAAAHVSGVAALMLERDHSLDPDKVHEILTASAKPVASGGRNDQYGWGLVDPARALLDVDAQLASEQHNSSVRPAAAKPGTLSSR